jgi:hypothetical protein
MTFRPLAFLSAIAVVASIAGCSGGGGKSTPAPTPTPTPTATPTPGGSTCSASSTAGVTGARRAPRASGGLVPNRLYVTYKAGVRSVASVEKNSAVVRTDDLGSTNGMAHHIVNLAPGVDAETMAASLRTNASVQSVDRLHYRSALGDGVANDTLLNNDDQWYLYKTNVDPGAWALTHGSPSISVAIIDTGVDLTGANRGGNDFNVTFAESVINGVRTTGNAAAQDTNGHGTNVAGLAVAQTNNTYGFAGVGWSTSLQAYRIFPSTTASSDCQTADSGDEALAINDAVTNGASVINLSLGSPQSGGFDPAEQNAIEAAISAGVVVVAAAGNEYPTSDGQQVDYPAAYPGVIAVGASAVGTHTANVYSSIQNEVVASYSNSGPTLVAPGGDAGTDTTGNDRLLWIEGYSTTTANFPGDQCTNSVPPGGTVPVCRVLFNGTSQATPQVSGAVALMMAKHGGSRSLSPAAVKSILTSTADNIGDTTARQGAGRLNTGNAVSHS